MPACPLETEVLILPVVIAAVFDLSEILPLLFTAELLILAVVRFPPVVIFTVPPPVRVSLPALITFPKLVVVEAFEVILPLVPEPIIFALNPLGIEIAPSLLLSEIFPALPIEVVSIELTEILPLLLTRFTSLPGFEILPVVIFPVVLIFSGFVLVKVELALIVRLTSGVVPPTLLFKLTKLPAVLSVRL